MNQPSWSWTDLSLNQMNSSNVDTNYTPLENESILACNRNLESLGKPRVDNHSGQSMDTGFRIGNIKSPRATSSVKSLAGSSNKMNFDNTDVDDCLMMPPPSNSRSLTSRTSHSGNVERGRTKDSGISSCSSKTSHACFNMYNWRIMLDSKLNLVIAGQLERYNLIV